MMFLLTSVIRRKEYITAANVSNDSNYQITSHLYVFSTTFLETGTNMFLYNKLTHNPPSLSDITGSIVYFIPVSFAFEIILDFFHYWSHRILHLNKYLYTRSHKTHHKFANPVMINAYYFSQTDIFCTIIVPMILTVNIFPYQLSFFDLVMISVYKQYSELAGHSGKMLAPVSSFPQCIWIPRLLNIELYAEDHDLHHKVSHCNFAKRFSLWDKIFGTYVHKRIKSAE